MSAVLHVLHVNSCFNQKFSEKKLIHEAAAELEELCKGKWLRMMISASRTQSSGFCLLRLASRIAELYLKRKQKTLAAGFAGVSVDKLNC